MVAAFVYLVFGIVELLLMARFVLLLIGANTASSLVSWIYTWSGPFAAPFSSIFGQHAITTGPGVVVQSVFDWPTLIAIIVYGVIGALLVRLLANI